MKIFTEQDKLPFSPREKSKVGQENAKRPLKTLYFLLECCLHLCGVWHSTTGMTDLASSLLFLALPRTTYVDPATPNNADITSPELLKYSIFTTALANTDLPKGWPHYFFS